MFIKMMMAFVCCAALCQAGELLNLSSTSGKEIQAELIAVKKGVAILKTQNGSIKRIPVKMFSEESIALLKEAHVRIQESKSSGSAAGNPVKEAIEVEVTEVSPGDTFSYGAHELKWLEDANGNRLIDQTEVELNKNGDWGALTAEEYTQIIERRRAQLYMENAYVYKKTETRDLELYVDFPEGWKASDKRPAIVWFFGGAWNTGTPFAFKGHTIYFAERGVVGVRVDYRIKTVDGIKNDGYISGMDAKTAIRWVRKNAASLGIDPGNIMAGGDSAGGHLALATQLPDLNDPDDDKSISAEVSALLLSNPYVVKINPDSWVYELDFKTLPPVWVSYGLQDKGAYIDDASSERTEKNGQTFIKELEAAGIPLRTYIKEGGHGFAMGGEHLRASVPDMDDFLVENALLEKGKAGEPGMGGSGHLSAHLKAIEKGDAQRSQPKMLEFVTK